MTDLQKPWTGPLPEDLADGMGTLKKPVPPERWPFCLPSDHDLWCYLKNGGLYCDCSASDESEP